MNKPFPAIELCEERPLTDKDEYGTIFRNKYGKLLMVTLQGFIYLDDAFYLDNDFILEGDTVIGKMVILNPKGS